MAVPPDAGGNALPVSRMKYHTVADIAAYVLTGISVYEGFAAQHPQAAFYVGMAAAALYMLSNKLAQLGD